jgi:Protein of unknown function (DUF2924)
LPASAWFAAGFFAGGAPPTNLTHPVGFGLLVARYRAFMEVWWTAPERRHVEPAVLTEIEKLRRASLAALRDKYREVFGEETRCRHRQHLVRRIAWRLQAMAEGDLTARARARASQLARDADLRMVAPRDFFAIAMCSSGKRPADHRLPLPGTLLSRKWKDRTILVEVVADGFRYEGRVYGSLSAIAVAVTGTRWNGLAFFGLTGKGRKESRHAEA